jgi:hypothetical protein
MKLSPSETKSPMNTIAGQAVSLSELAPVGLRDVTQLLRQVQQTHLVLHDALI